MVRQVHKGLGSSSVVADVLHYVLSPSPQANSVVTVIGTAVINTHTTRVFRSPEASTVRGVRTECTSGLPPRDKYNPPLSSSPHAHIFGFGPAVINKSSVGLIFVSARTNKRHHHHQNGLLTHPQDIDLPLLITAQRKIQSYRQQCTANHKISFLPAIVSAPPRACSASFCVFFFYRPGVPEQPVDNPTGGGCILNIERDSETGCIRNFP
jgi:hypothetical protein